MRLDGDAARVEREFLLKAISGINCRLSHTVDKRPLQQSADELSTFKNLYLLTDLGRLDLLGSLPPIEDIEDVFRKGELMDVGGLQVRVICLDHLIAVKAAMNRPKDRMVETELRAIASVRNTSPQG